MKKIQLINQLKAIIFVVEIVIAVLILFGVAAGLISTLLQIPFMVSITRDQFYNSFRNFLGSALLLIVGVELIRMLITHTTRATLDLIVFVIARKLLIYTDSMTDIFLGTVSLALAFATIKFLLPAKPGRLGQGYHFSGQTRIRAIEDRMGIELPVSGDQTLSEFLHIIRTQPGSPVAGEQIEAGPVRITVGSVSAQGVILDAQITDAGFVIAGDGR